MKTTSRHLRLHLLGILALAPLFSAALPAPSESRTWYIKADGTGDAPTIQGGIDAASDGDIILVAAGNYPTTSSVNIGGTLTPVCVAIGKNVRLLSESGSQLTTIGSPTAKIVIYVHDVGTGVEINGFKIQTTFQGYFCVDSAKRAALTSAGSLPPALKRAITCQNAAPLIKSNEIADNGAGIELLNSPANVTENLITRASYGVACFDGADAIVSQNVIHQCGALVSSEASSPTVIDNELYDACDGVRSHGGVIVVNGNVMHDLGPYGITADAGSITIENNQLSNTRTAIQVTTAVGVCRIAGNILRGQVVAIDLSGNPQATMYIEENTIDGTGGTAIFCQSLSSPTIRRNIITNSTRGIGCALSSFPVMECNDVVTSQGRYVGDCSDQTGVNGNISVDPQYCGVLGTDNYGLQNDSPCAAGNHPDGVNCGRIGARDVVCGPVATRPVTWGEIKAMYRR